MEQKCANCGRFIKHYIKSSGRFNEIDNGHCVYPRLKHRDGTQKACEHFIEREEETKIHMIEIEIKHRTL